MTQTIQQITSLNWKCHSIEKTQIKRKYVDVNQTGCPSGLRRQTQDIPQSRILVHECVHGFESNSCQKTFWTRRGRAFSWQILSYWNAIQDDSPKQKKTSKRKQTTHNVIRGWQPSGLKMHKKEDTQQRHVKHQSTRGFERKSFQMDDTNRLAD